MIILAVLSLLSSFRLFSHPDSVDISVDNHLQNRTIAEISYIVPGSFYLHTVDLRHPVSPNSQVTIRVPYGYINKLIFVTEDGTVYTRYGYPASTNPEPITVSLADKDFGGLFERVYGIYPIAIQNSTDVSFVSVFLQGDSTPCENLLRNNILLPDEILRIWLDSGITAQVYATDTEGNIPTLITISAPSPDTLYRITPDLFFGNGIEIGYDESPGTWVINCITLDKIKSVEAFSSNGSFLDGVDCSSSPIGTWDKVYIRHTESVGFIVVTDVNNRTYTTSEPDSITSYFMLGDLNLDFDYGFPE